MNRRLSLSLIAMISSVFMFVFASFAWLQISDRVSVFGPTGNVVNIQQTVVLYASQDGINYLEDTSMSISSGAPGNIYYFEVYIENTGDIAISSKVVLYGFTTELSDPSGYDTGYLAGRSLVEVLRVNTSNNSNSEVIDNELMIDLLPDIPSGDFSESFLTLLSGVDIGVGENITLSVSFTLDEAAGNDYQNLMLLISSISVQSTTQ